MNFRLLCACLLSIVAATSCKKHSDNVYLPSDATGDFDGYRHMDTLTVFTSTVREDSLRTDSLSHNLLGVINDPVFGESKASSFAQFRLPQVGNVISSQTLDSVVLFLQFTSPTAYYGDLNTNFGFKVYELDQSMNSGITHSNTTYS